MKGLFYYIYGSEKKDTPRFPVYIDEEDMDYDLEKGIPPSHIKIDMSDVSDMSDNYVNNITNITASTNNSFMTRIYRLLTGN